MFHFYKLLFFELIPARTNKIPLKINDSHTPILSLGLLGFAKRKGMCSNIKQDNIKKLYMLVYTSEN
jgi:hypothetical protein